MFHFRVFPSWWSLSRLARGSFWPDSSILGSIRPQFSCRNYLGSDRKTKMKDDSLPTCRTFPGSVLYSIYIFCYFLLLPRCRTQTIWI